MDPYPRRPTRIGLPYHGRVDSVSGAYRLTSHGGGTKTLADFDSALGSAWAVYNAEKRNTRDRTEAEVAYDTAQKAYWQNYALVRGMEKVIAGTAKLGPWEWLYSDPAGTVWLMRVSLATTPSTADIVATVKVIERFGYFGPTKFEPCNRTVGAYTHTVTIPTLLDEYYSTSFSAEETATIMYQPDDQTAARLLDFLPDGSEACLNLWPSPNQFFYPDAYGQYLGWIAISVSGTGSLNLASLGSGITATMTSAGLDEVVLTLMSADAPEVPDPGDFYGYWDVTTTIDLPDYSCPHDDVDGYPAGEVSSVFTGTKTVNETWIAAEQELVVYRYADGTLVIYNNKTESTVAFEAGATSGTLNCDLAANGQCEGGVWGWNVYGDCGTLVISYGEAYSDYVRDDVHKEVIKVGTVEAGYKFTFHTETHLTQTNMPPDNLAYGPANNCGATTTPVIDGGSTDSTTLTILPTAEELVDPELDHDPSLVYGNAESVQVWKAWTEIGEGSPFRRIWVAQNGSYVDGTEDDTAYASWEPVVDELVASPNPVGWI